MSLTAGKSSSDYSEELYVYEASAIVIIERSPEVPQVPFAGGQSGQGGEDLLQDELPVLLVAGKHLRRS